MELTTEERTRCKRVGLCTRCGAQLAYLGRVQCLRCTNKKKYYKRKVGKEYRGRIKTKAFEGYGGKCKICGIEDVDVLQLDHVFNNGKADRAEKGGNSQALYAWVIRENYPDDYQVLCANCNVKKKMLYGEEPKEVPWGPRKLGADENTLLGKRSTD